MQKSNVVPIAPEGDEAESAEKFRQAYSRYLRAHAAYWDPNSTDVSMEKDLPKLEEAIWQLVRTPAILDYQITDKLRVVANLFEGMDTNWVDRRDRALLNSVILDLEARS